MTERAALITGASRGIGLAVARAFAARGDRVMLVARGEEALRRATEEIRATGGSAWYLPLDVTDADACAAMAAEAQRQVGTSEICVLSAGIGHWAPTVSMTDEQWRETMAVNVDAAFYATRAVLPPMLERGRGHIVYISSVLGRKGVPNMAAYAASKAAVAAFAESVAAEVKPAGVKVTVLYPGTTATEMRAHQTDRPQTPDITDPELQLEPEDVADAVLWATSVDDRAYPTSVTIEPRGVAGIPARRRA
jgi:NAD(P)-dependent dehydrogenase (short-subunit alcohol dehydrogenase family)